MQVYVEPLKRAGERKLISCTPINQVSVDRDNGCLVLTFEAGGMYDNKSKYKYTLELSADSAETLRAALAEGMLDTRH
jgi:hypothetical protein